MNALVDPIDSIHAESDLLKRQIRTHYMKLRRQIQRWEPRPIPPRTEFP